MGEGQFIIAQLKIPKPQGGRAHWTKLHYVEFKVFFFVGSKLEGILIGWLKSKLVVFKLLFFHSLILI